VVATGLIVIIVIVVLAIVGSSGAARVLSVAEAAQGSYQNQRVQVSGNVVENSFTTTGTVLTFTLYDPTEKVSTRLSVSYAGAVSATFGNGIEAICTGKIDADGVLQASELVTKCPSKYENATSALSVQALLNYGDSVINKPVRVAGAMKAGSLRPAGQDARFVLVDPQESTELIVVFDGALFDEIQDNCALVLTGTLDSDLRFNATVVALEE
jgi:cytochrome c-type biogenesis protein CcmE